MSPKANRGTPSNMSTADTKSKGPRKEEPKIRRTLQKEIADYQANAEARAFAAEQAAEQVAAAAAARTATKQPT